MNEALVVFAYGKGWVLAWEADAATEQFIRDVGGSSDGFDLDSVGADYDPKTQGIVVGDLKIIDDGPGDWPGSRECALQFADPKPVTEEEWRKFREGEWPW